MLGYIVLALCAAGAVSLLTWSFADPSFTHATNSPTRNLLGPVGAIFSDLTIQLLGLAGVFVLLPPLFWGLQLVTRQRLPGARTKLMLAPVAVVLLACAASSLPKFGNWPLPYSFGGVLGDQALTVLTSLLAMVRPERASAAAGLFCCAGGLMLLITSLGLSQQDLKRIYPRSRRLDFTGLTRGWQKAGNVAQRATIARQEPVLPMPHLQPVMAQVPSRHLAPAFKAEQRTTPRYHRQVVDLEEEPSGSELPNDDGDPDGAKRMAEIFAPEISAGSPRSSDRAGLRQPAAWSADPMEAHRPDISQGGRSGRAERRLEWPAPEETSSPEADAPRAGWRPHSVRHGDDLYGRAVAIVLGDRKATTAYLQQRLAIGYMRAADLLDRMEQEGILGAPVHNGIRPILISEIGSREI
jgi:DNA segregation ATPase FtsK/SpoIIIE-like protein